MCILYLCQSEKLHWKSKASKICNFSGVLLLPALWWVPVATCWRQPGWFMCLVLCWELKCRFYIGDPNLIYNKNNMERKKTGDQWPQSQLCNVCIKHVHLEEVTSISAGLSEWLVPRTGCGFRELSDQQLLLWWQQLQCFDLLENFAAPNWFPPASALNCGKDSVRKLLLWARNMGIL